MNKTIILVIAIMLMTLIGRSYQLDSRPMHTDEAVHAIKFIDLLENGNYKYDPHEYHGPTLYYLSLPIAWLRGHTNGTELNATTLRFITVLASMLFFIPLIFMARITKGNSAVIAALATVVSPIAFYFSRYYIHEVFLTGFIFAFIVCAWRYTINHKLSWAIASGAYLGLALATKETVSISIVAIAIAFMTTTLTEPDLRNRLRHKNNLRYIAIGLVATIAFVIVLYSSFFNNFSGIVDSIRSQFNFLHRASGQGHAKPWNYYLNLLIYFNDRPGFTGSEIYFILPALVTGVAAFSRGINDNRTREFIKFLSIFSLALIIIYSCIPYKMPWLALNWMQPMTVITGIGIYLAFTKFKNIVPRLIITTACLLAACHLGYQIYRENGRFMCDTRNPYVYSHTGTDFLRLPDLVKHIGSVSALNKSLPITVITDDPWPLPWYLREFKFVGYCKSIPKQQIKSPLVIVSATIATELYATMESEYTHGIYGLRNGVLLVAFVRNDLWKKYIDQKISLNENKYNQ